MKKYTKGERQSFLKEIIRGRGIADQVELLILLRERGLETTQATISRDLQEIGVAKLRGGHGLAQYALLESRSRDQLMKRLSVYFDNFVSRIDDVGYMVLIHTTPGNASGLASFIDRMEQSEILATIAGDDTILVVVDSEENRIRVKEIFLSIQNPSGL